MNKTNFAPASEKDYSAHIIKPFDDVPITELVSGSYSHLVSLKEMTISFIRMKAGSVFDLHSHPNEQCMIVTEGYYDEIIGDKIYRVQKGDVIYLPANVPHGAFIPDHDCCAIDIFSPSRKDYIEKYILQNSTSPKFVQNLSFARNTNEYNE